MLDDLTSRMDLYADPQGDVDTRLVPLTFHELQLLILGVSRVSKQAEQDHSSQRLPLRALDRRLRGLLHHAWQGEALPAEFAAPLEAAVQDVRAASEQQHQLGNDLTEIQDRHNARWERAWRGRQDEGGEGQEGED